MDITVDNRLRLSSVPNYLSQAICGQLTIVNPLWEESQRMGRWIGDTPQLLRHYEQSSESGLVVPWRFGGQLVRLCLQHNVRFQIIDRRRKSPPLGYTFNGDLRPYQTDAVKEMLRKDFGVLDAPTGSGKTVMVLYLIAQRQQPTVIIVHSRNLPEQWCEQIEKFLAVSQTEIGVIGGSKFRVGEKITVALVDSLIKRVDEVVPYTGMLLVDECHRCPSQTMTDAASAFDCHYTKVIGDTLPPGRAHQAHLLVSG